MDRSQDLLVDRRAAARVDCQLVAQLSDYHYEWDAACLSLSAGGCFVAVSQLFAPGKELAITLHHEGGAITLDAMVRWVRGPNERRTAGLGLGFDPRDRTRIEAIADLVERIAVEDVVTATRFRSAGRPLPMDTDLYRSRTAPKDPTLSVEERAFLSAVGRGAGLRAIQETLGSSEWEATSHAAFSLLAKGVLTRERARAELGHPGQSGPPRPVVARDVRARGEKAQRFYDQAIEALREGKKGLALTNLRLAIMLAPGDAEISAALADLEA